MALISVIIPCYNAEAFLADAVRSVQAQTHQDFECLLVDDGSGDGTRALIERLAREDLRLRPIILPRNQGVSAARNAALDAARGEWVALLDADDLWEPQRLARLLQAAEAMGADFVGDNLKIVTFPDGRLLRLALDPQELNGVVWTTEAFLERCSYVSVGETLSILQPLMRRAFIDAHKLRYDARFRSSEDFRLYAEALIAGARFVTIGEAGYIVRTRPGSLTRSGAWAREASVTVCDDLLARYGAQLSGAARASLLRRRRTYARLAAYAAFTFALRKGQVGAALGTLARTPGLLLAAPGVFARRIGRAVTRADES